MGPHEHRPYSRSPRPWAAWRALSHGETREQALAKAPEPPDAGERVAKRGRCGRPRHDDDRRPFFPSNRTTKD
ncbi:MAG: hypothetical protein JO116_20380 [Planctomycetaceae bacterium]|nr:hypothetical protein [Planctomycetaceae bacterium]MBV8611003.1 hypothetical protein [Singulisphaera sp.]